MKNGDLPIKDGDLPIKQTVKRLPEGDSKGWKSQYAAE